MEVLPNLYPPLQAVQYPVSKYSEKDRHLHFSRDVFPGSISTQEKLDRLVDDVLLHVAASRKVTNGERRISDINYLYKNISNQIDYFRISFFALTFLLEKPFVTTVFGSFIGDFTGELLNAGRAKLQEFAPKIIKNSFKKIDPHFEQNEDKFSIFTVVKVAYISVNALFKTAYHMTWCLHIAALIMGNLSLPASFFAAWQMIDLRKDIRRIKIHMNVMRAHRKLLFIDDCLPLKLENDEVLRRNICPIKQSPILYPVSGNCHHLFEAKLLFQHLLFSKYCPLCKRVISTQRLVFDALTYQQIKYRIQTLQADSLS